MDTQLPKVSIIILNYNTWDITINEINNIENVISYNNLEVIIVDNCSTNNSYDELNKYINKSSFKYNYRIIQNSRNAGYAAGNNVGIKESINGGAVYSLIINNDILFVYKDTISQLVQCLDSNNTIGVVSPRIVSPNGEHDKPIYYRKPTFWDLSFGLKSFVKGINLQNDENIYPIYAPRGSCMFLRNKDLQDIDFLDEGTFLYYEEPILAERLLSIGKTALNLGSIYVIHNHSITIKKNVSRKRNRLFVVQSMDYYLKKYRSFNSLQRCFCRFIRKYAYLISHK